MGEFLTGARRRAFSPGDVLVANIDSAIAICPLPGLELRFQAFFVALDTLFPLLAPGEIPRLHALVETFKAGRIFSAASKPASESRRLLENLSPEVDLEHRLLLLRVAAALLASELKASADRPVSYASAGEHALRVFEQLSAEELANLPVDELARRFNCSPRHLNRLFHSRFGLSVSALRLELRLLKALSLLRDPQAKIVNVAEESGFNHLGFFNFCFKRRFGLNPSQWRKTALGSEAKNPTVQPALAQMLPSLSAQNLTAFLPPPRLAHSFSLPPLPLALAAGSAPERPVAAHAAGRRACA